jgi:hypothetical protein
MEGFSSYDGDLDINELYKKLVDLNLEVEIG